MAMPFLTRPYEKWAPVIGRILVSITFLAAAWGHLPGSESAALQAGMAGAAGIPFPEIALLLAFVLELVAGLMMLVGYMTRMAAFFLMLYVIVLTLIFHTSFADPMATGMFISHLALIGGLLYMSTYGAQSAGVETCPLPQGLTKTN